MNDEPCSRKAAKWSRDFDGRGPRSRPRRCSSKSGRKPPRWNKRRRSPYWPKQLKYDVLAYRVYHQQRALDCRFRREMLDPRNIHELWLETNWIDEFETEILPHTTRISSSLMTFVRPLLGSPTLSRRISMPLISRDILVLSSEPSARKATEATMINCESNEWVSDLSHFLVCIDYKVVVLWTIFMG